MYFKGSEIPIFSPNQVLEIAPSFVLAYGCSHYGAKEKVMLVCVVV